MNPSTVVCEQCKRSMEDLIDSGDHHRLCKGIVEPVNQAPTLLQVYVDLMWKSKSGDGIQVTSNE